MIIRILGEGQFAVDDTHLARLNELDGALEAVIEAADESAFPAALAELLEAVRSVGSAVPADSLDPSDLILPDAGSSLDEVRGLLTGEGLIPG